MSETTSKTPSPSASGGLLDRAGDHLATVLTVAYLAVTGVGMLSTWALFARFDLNVFRFAQVGDFLLAATALPVASASVLIAGALLMLLFLVDRHFDRYRWYRLLYGDSERVRRMLRAPAAWVLYAVLYAWVAAQYHAGWYVAKLRRGEIAPVTVQLQSGTYLGVDGSRPFNAQLMGTTSAYLFLYDLESDRVTVVPVENLASLEPGDVPPSGS